MLDEKHAALTALAKRYDVSLSWLTRRAVAEFLARKSVIDLPLRAGRKLINGVTLVETAEFHRIDAPLKRESLRA